MPRTRAGDQARFVVHAIVALIFCILFVILLVQGRILGLVLAPFALVEAAVAFHYLNGLMKTRTR